MADFKPDQTVYLPDGREAVYFARLKGRGHLVRLCYTSEFDFDGTGNFIDERLSLVPKVLEHPPVAQYEKGIATLRATQAALQRKAEPLRQEQRRLQQEIARLSGEVIHLTRLVAVRREALAKLENGNG
jgi:hypothetical protein